MQLEINKNYVTENGSIVKIKIEDKNTLQPFGGVIIGRGSAFYTSNGIYNLNNINSGFNIVKEFL